MGMETSRSIAILTTDSFSLHPSARCPSTQLITAMSAETPAVQLRLQLLQTKKSRCPRQYVLDAICPDQPLKERSLLVNQTCSIDLPQIGRQDVQFRAILSHRAASDNDAFVL